MTVTSVLLGELTVRSDELLTLPAGLYGFEAHRAFVLVSAGRDNLWWLQSMERPELVFLLADPFKFFAGYEIDVPDADLAALGVAPDTIPLVLVIVTLPAGRAESPTANLRAPLLVDPTRRVARQVVLADDALSMTAALGL
ncbi:MAG: flagellar assembly protein FliW [Gemmatirosa sp.]|nr:flagellar assembly protein FliW [Gemmatirosa sp.]